MTNTDSNTPLLQMRGIRKQFPGVLALDGVDFSVSAGQIHALMGENGAGKSTLIKVLTGAHHRDGGQALFEGLSIDPRTPRQAQMLGISTVYQEVNLIPELSVAENITLGRQPRHVWGGIHWKQVNQRAQAAMKRLNIDIDVTRPVSSYSIALQQMVAIARSLDISARLLILDEPTSSLDADEVEQLFQVMRRLRDQGMGIVFVTHFLDQVYQVSDRITILRNGRLVGEYEAAKLPRVELVARMMGKELAGFSLGEKSEARTIQADAPPVAEAVGLGRRGSVAPFDLKLTAGQTVGLAGLLGSGRSEIARLFFGVDQADKGKLLVNGLPVTIRNPRHAVSLGFGLCSEDRKTQGIIPDLSIRENIVLAMQARAGWLSYFSRKRQTELANQYIKALKIVCHSVDQPIKTLSGGNQQKVLLARWLAMNPQILILDEPTRGIDVGAKAEIQKLILELCREGKAVLFIASELEEIVRCSDRVAVLRDRAKVCELAGSAISEEGIMHAIAGGGHG